MPKRLDWPLGENLLMMWLARPIRGHTIARSAALRKSQRGGRFGLCGGGRASTIGGTTSATRLLGLLGEPKSHGPS